MRLLGYTAADYRRMNDSELLRLTRYDGWSYDYDLVDELKRRGLA